MELNHCMLALWLSYAFLRKWTYKDLIITKEACGVKKHTGSLRSHLSFPTYHSVSQLLAAAAASWNALLPSSPSTLKTCSPWGSLCWLRSAPSRPTHGLLLPLQYSPVVLTTRPEYFPRIKNWVNKSATNWELGTASPVCRLGNWI